MFKYCFFWLIVSGFICGVAQEEQEIPPEYLVIAPQQFVVALQPLLEWRVAEGMEVTVTTINDIRNQLQIDGAISADRLQEYLLAYYCKRPNLMYVVLVGDVEFIPVKYHNGIATDYYYSLLGIREDLLADVYLGRFPVNNAEQVSAIVHKILAYEMGLPNTQVLLSAYFQDVDQNGISDSDCVYTSELFHEYFTGNEILCKTVYCKTPGSIPNYYSNGMPVPANIDFNGQSQDIVDCINMGIGVINHCGPGDHSGWLQPQFNCENIEQLYNTQNFIMFNINSSTGKFDVETATLKLEFAGTKPVAQQECFSEQLLTVADKGAVAVIAPTRQTNSTLNNTFSCGLMEAIWPRMFHSYYSPATRLGQIMYRGRTKLVRDIGNGHVSSQILANFHCYHILGDPALRIRYTHK